VPAEADLSRQAQAQESNAADDYSRTSDEDGSRGEHGMIPLQGSSGLYPVILIRGGEYYVRTKFSSATCASRYTDRSDDW